MVEPFRNPPIGLIDNPPKGKAKLTALLGISAATLLITTVAGFEGKRNDPYLDIVKVQTVCYGETRVAMRRYSDAECSDMLAGGLADFAGPVLERNPELAGRDGPLVAASSLAYNIGAANYRKSTVARQFSAMRFRAACDAFLMWSNAGGKRVAGLVKRREAERAICLRGVK